RRRHTRCLSDWSSDVCSSDLPFADETSDGFRRSLEVNLVGSFRCAQRALPAMRARGYGRIVAIGSSAGITGGTRACAAYAASKEIGRASGREREEKWTERAAA